MMDMYQENILDHAQNPRNWGLLDPCDHHAHDENPLCGDELEITLRIDDTGHVVELGWDGHGCAISQATASMLGEEILGKTLDEVKALQSDYILELVGIPLSMNRVKCAMLSLKVLKTAAYGLDSE